MKKEDILELINSWENLDFLLKGIDHNQEQYGLLMDITLNSPDKKSWRAAYLVDKVNDKYPELIIPYLEPIIIKLKTLHDLGKKRHFLKLISMHEIPESYSGFLVDFCLNTLASAEPPAVRVHAMQVLYNISEKEQDLKPELIQVIEQEIEFRATAGIISRGSRLLERLRKQVS